MNTGNGPFGPIVNGTQIVFFEYRPSAPAGYAFTAIFGLLTLAHLIYMLWQRSWFFIPFILGGIAETFGYLGRAFASSNPTKAGPFIQQNLLILIGTPFLAASVYMSLGRLVSCLKTQDQRHPCMNMRWITPIYVLVDIACIASQFIGAILPASGDPAASRKARIILLAGLIAQVVALSLFLCTTWCVHRRLRRKDTPELLLGSKSLTWQKCFLAVEAVTVLMIVRSLVRTIEYAQGSGGYVLRHEVFIYVFDAAIMAAVMVVLLVVYPGRFVRDMRSMKDEGGKRVLLEDR